MPLKEAVQKAISHMAEKHRAKNKGKKKKNVEDDIRVRSSNQVVEHDPGAAFQRFESSGGKRLEDVEDPEQDKSDTGNDKTLRQEPKGHPHAQNFINRHLCRVVAVKCFHRFSCFDSQQKNKKTCRHDNVGMLKARYQIDCEADDAADGSGSYGRVT